MLTLVASTPGAVKPMLQRVRRQINHRLAELLFVNRPHRCDGLSQAMRHALLGPGKRLRPTLATLVGLEWSSPAAATLDAGCAIEMVHAASLILDDLPAMDNATLRRGQPTTHVVHGVDVAMLAAIALLARAFSVLHGLWEVTPERRLELVALLCDAVGEHGLAGGQMLDLRGSEAERDFAALANSCALKTGTLFTVVVKMTATLADANDERCQRMLAFASHFGMAYQIADDLTDAIEDAAEQATCVGLLGSDAARRLQDAHVESALAHLPSRQGPLAVWVTALFSPPRMAVIAPQ